VLFVITFITAIAAVVLYGPVIDDPRYVVSSGSDTRVLFGGLMDVLLVIANIGTAVVLFPILKRQNEGVALGYVTARIVECIFIVIGIVSLLSVVTLRQDLAGSAGADAASLVTAGKSLVASYEWTFLFGPGLLAGLGNGLLLGYLMYRSGLVPRPMAMLGLIGGTLLAAAFVAVLFGVFEEGSAGQFILSAPEIAWEASLGIYLIVKGFRPSPVLREGSAAGGTS
jgi:hypothetical protein